MSSPLNAYHKDNEESVKRCRRPNITFPFDKPPCNKEDYKKCDIHQLYSLHNCPRCVIEKREATMIQRHGVRAALCSKELMNKKNATSLERYDTEHPLKLKEAADQRAVVAKLPLHAGARGAAGPGHLGQAETAQLGLLQQGMGEGMAALLLQSRGLA